MRNKKRAVLWLFAATAALVFTFGPVAPVGATAQYGGTILYYDANWNQVGYWYKPCNGNSTRWGVVGVHTVIDDFYTCDCNCVPNGCHPVITHDSPIDQLPNPSLSLVCG